VEREDEARGQGQDRPDDRHGQRRMPVRPTREPKEHAGGPRVDRFVLADAPQVLGELERRRVASLAVAFERGLEDDLDVLVIADCAAADRERAPRAFRRWSSIREGASNGRTRVSASYIATAIEYTSVRRSSGASRPGAARRHVGRRPKTSPDCVNVATSDCSCARGRSSRTAWPSPVIIVSGVHVAVNDAGLVRGVQRARDARSEEQEHASVSERALGGHVA